MRVQGCVCMFACACVGCWQEACVCMCLSVCLSASPASKNFHYQPKTKTNNCYPTLSTLQANISMLSPHTQADAYLTLTPFSPPSAVATASSGAHALDMTHRHQPVPTTKHTRASQHRALQAQHRALQDRCAGFRGHECKAGMLPARCELHIARSARGRALACACAAGAGPFRR
jgi:hypothetical protein